jgi:two-component system, cell cycle sensor histidine kinase and response regulator CckA
VLIFRFEPDLQSGRVVAEAVESPWVALLSTSFRDSCFLQDYAEQYRQGRVTAIADIQAAELEPCYREFLTRLQVRANLVVPIIGQDSLWGLIVAQHCSAPRLWQVSEIALLQQLAIKVGIVLYRIELDLQAQTELAKSEFYYRTLAQNFPAIVYRLFPAENNRVVFFNNMLQTLFGYECENLEGGEVCSIENFIISEDKPRVIATVKDAIARNQPFKLEYRLRDRAGEIRYCWEHGIPIYHADGQLLLIDGVIFDITEKKQLEQQFYRIQRLESLGTLASGIAHDLNNILSPILVAAQLLPLKLPNLDERSQKLLKMQEVNAKRATQLVKQILSFARGVEGQRSLVQIQQLLLDIEQIAKSTFPKSIEIATDIPDNLFTVFANASQLHQVLMNLLVNARDAMPSGGTLTIAAKKTFIDENYAKMSSEALVGAYVTISFTDTGVGIPQSIIERIFDPYFTTKDLDKGTGLGLSTTLKIVKNHGGFMSVRSEVGFGTRFQVYLPAKDDTISETPENQEIPTGEGELILLVDDEAAIVEATKATLENYNYRILVASDGIDAIAIYAQYQNEISVVITDMMMPSMDGEITICTLQKLNPQVQIIAMSGLTSTEMMAKVARTGVKQFLAKPFTTQELLNCLHHQLHCHYEI